MLKILFVVLLAMVLASGQALADEVQKVGTTSVQTLKVPMSVRAIGMGNAYCAAADDIQSVFWNPAGLIYLDRTAAIFTHINMPADIQLNSMAVAHSLGPNGVVGFHLLAMNTDDMPVRTITRPEGTNENFIAYDIVGGVSYARRLTDRFTFGFNLRIINSGLEEEKYTGLLADIGGLYQTALRSLRLGFSVQNFGQDIDYSGTYSDYKDQGRRDRESPQDNDYTAAPPPTIYRLGASGNLFALTGIEKPDNWDGVISFEMNHPNDNREKLNFGLELTFMDMISMRGGHKLSYKNTYGYDEERWTAGLGLKIPLPSGRNVRLDYAYQTFGKIAEAVDGFMASPHRFSLAIKF